MKIIAVIIGAYVMYQLQQYLYRRFWNKNLSVCLSLSDDKAIEGEELILYETIMNKKLLPIPILKVKFMTSRYLSFLDTNNSEITDNYYRNDLLSVMMYQKLTREESFRCTHRGYFSIDKMVLVCRDILMTSEYVSRNDIDVHLYVYPKPVAYNKFQIPFQKMLGTVLSKRYINEDPFEFRSIREYQSYDTLKTVNWKASAKTGSLKVNVFDHTSSQQIKILLNLELETIWKYEDIQEESIRIAATFASNFIDQGIPTSIYTNALDLITKEVLNVPSGSGNNHMRTMNETLARIDTTLKIPPFVPTIQEEVVNATHKDYIILISSYQKEDLQLLLSPLVQSKMDFSWIIPHNQEIKLSASNEFLSHVIPWEL
jgi:hypothetical protein